MIELFLGKVTQNVHFFLNQGEAKSKHIKRKLFFFYLFVYIATTIATVKETIAPLSHDKYNLNVDRDQPSVPT